MHNEVKYNNTIWETAVLVLLMEWTYEVHRFDDLRWHDNLPNFMKIATGVRAILKSYLSNLKLSNVGITDVEGGGIYEVRR
jgi:hypothetical protein